MNDTVIVAIITAASALLGEYFLTKRNSKDLYAKLDKNSELADERLNAKLERFQAVTDTKLEALTTEVRKHNNFAVEIPTMKAEIKNIHHRLKEIKSEVQK